MSQARGESGDAHWLLVRLGAAIFCTLNVMMFTMALWTQEVYGAAGAASAADPLFPLFRYLALLFSAPVLLLLGEPLLENAWQNLRRGAITADLLLAIGVVASYAVSVVSVLEGTGPVYFEVGCVVLVMVSLGRWLEATGKLQAGEALESLEKLLAPRARVWGKHSCPPGDLGWHALSMAAKGVVQRYVAPRPDHAHHVHVQGVPPVDDSDSLLPLAQVRVGQTIRVLPGERIPLDGEIVRGLASLDEQLVSGESRPVERSPGDKVFSGALNLDGDLLIRVTAPVGAGTLRRMIDLVHHARSHKGYYQRLADRVAAWLLPSVVAISLAAAAWHGWQSGAQYGLLVGLSVVVIACPCALGLATPLAVWKALGAASRSQVLFRNSDALTALADADRIFFDKTGTLTTSEPCVTRLIVAHEVERDEVLARAAVLAAANRHALSVALSAYVRQSPADPTVQAIEMSEVRAWPGCGVQGTSRGGDTFLGSLRWLQVLGLVPHSMLCAAAGTASDAGEATVAIGWAGQVRGLFLIREELRSEAREALHELSSHGARIEVLTGDDARRGHSLAQQLGVPVRAGLRPEDKLAIVQSSRTRRKAAAPGPSRRRGVVVMIGDGINDAPALAAADVGVALGCGSEVSREAADICLLNNDLRRIRWAIALARRTRRTIRQNLFWACAYNALGVGLAAAGSLNPVIAAIAMGISSVLVVGNSLRLAGESSASQVES